MTFTQIKYFIAVVDCMSISKAAEVMYITQSAMSRQIALLEQELGMRLFTRSNRKISLTTAGKIIYDSFVRIQSDLDNALSEAATKSTDIAGKISVGAFSGAEISSLYSTTVDDFCKKHPRVELSYELYSLGDLWEKLNDNQIDCLITTKESLPTTKGLFVWEVCSISIGLLCSADYMQEEDPDSFLHQSQHKLIATEEPALRSYFKRILRTLQKRGIDIEPIWTPNYFTMVQLVRQGKGLMLIDDFGLFLPEIGLKKLVLHGMQSTLCVVSRHKTPVVSAFASAIVQNGNPFEQDKP